MRYAVLFACCSLSALFAYECDEPSANTEWRKDPPWPASLERPRPQRQPRDTPHPRIVLDDAMRARLKRHAVADSPLWDKVEHYCREWVKENASSGYQGSFWNRAVVSLSLCWHATGDKAYHDAAFRVLDAILDDEAEVGDGKGGAEVVHTNMGYPIRNFGFPAALAYDWLHDAPGMTAARKKKIVRRLDQWLSWYAKDGYLNDNAHSNYFWGYMTTLAIAALAVHGEDPVADKWLAEARRLLETEVIPNFYVHLDGGAWPEGWQYGQLVAIEVSFVARAFQTAMGLDYAVDLPWLSQLVDSRLHRLRPDGKTAYGNGTQASTPPPPRAGALHAALLAVETSDPQKAAEARFLLYDVFPEVKRQYGWFAVLSDEPEGQPRRDPRAGEPLSYHMDGPGLTFARSSWDPDAVWVSFQAGPKISIDHQNQDQGHFEIWRGGDGLLIDGGDGGVSATINHNSILIDDGGDVLPYSPSQSVYGLKVDTTHFADDGQVVVAVGELADAWSPKCVMHGCDEREVTRATRTFVYVRPNVVVTDDVVELESADTWVAWAGHLRAKPRIRGRVASAVWGDSRLDLTWLLPEKGEIEAPKEPTEDSDHVFRRNEPAFDQWRLQLVTDKGQKARRMRAWMAVDAAKSSGSAARALGGKGLSGAIGRAGEQSVAVLFADSPRGGTAALPASGADAVVVTGLTKGGRYRVAVARQGKGCTVTAQADAQGKHAANAGGFLRFAASGCQAR